MSDGEDNSNAEAAEAQRNDQPAISQGIFPVYQEIFAERLRQAKLFPDQEKELDMFVGTAVLSEECGEVNRAALECREAVLKHGPLRHHDCREQEKQLREELIHAAATAVLLIELLDRNALYINTPAEIAFPIDFPNKGEAEPFPS